MTKFGTLTPNGVIDEMELDLEKVKSSDPLAYAYGYFHGKSGKELAKKGENGLHMEDEDLAEEYIRGYNDGVKAR